MLLTILIKFILPYLLPVLFTAFVAISESYRLRDAVKYSNEWHRYKGYYQATFFALVATFDFWYACAAASVFWIAHDIIINVFGFRLHWYYIGVSAFSDRLFGSFAAQLVFKILFLVFSICGMLGMFDGLFDFLT